MEHDASLSNGADQTLTLTPTSADASKNVGGGGDGEVKALVAEIGGLRAEKLELERELEAARRERDAVAAEAQRLEGEIERARVDLFAAASVVEESECREAELAAERDGLRAEIARLEAAAEAKEDEIAVLEHKWRLVDEAHVEDTMARARREEELRKQNALLVEKIREEEVALMKLGEWNSSLQAEIVKHKHAVQEFREKNSVLEGEAAAAAAASAVKDPIFSRATLVRAALAGAAGAVAAAAVSAVILHRRS